MAEAEEIMMIGSQMACWLSLRKVRRSTPKREHSQRTQRLALEKDDILSKSFKEVLCKVLWER